MLDVHPPHSAVHGIRDFLLHLFTITVGLLIALGLEGCVERSHHRHLVHEAEASLRAEIQNNSKILSSALTDLQKQQDALAKDIDVLNYIVKNHKAPEHSSMEIGSSVRDLANVAWKTAQTTTAVAYMPYPEVQEYAEIYSTQEDLKNAELQATRDAIISIGPLGNGPKGDSDPTGGYAEEVRGKVEILLGQLRIVDSLTKSLEGQYKRFLASHPSAHS